MEDSVFAKLNAVDVREHVEKKGKFDYLSWADAVTYLLEACPDATWAVAKFELRDYPSVPFNVTPFGVFVEVSVTVNGITRTQVHPVLGHNNKPISEPSSFDINTSIARCLTKAIALHGLGLSVYRGEDLPSAPTSRTEAPRASSKPASKPATSGEKMASDSQMKFLRSLARQAKIDDPSGGKTISAVEVRKLIDQLKEPVKKETPDVIDPPPEAPEEYAWHDDWIGECCKCGAQIGEGYLSLLHLESGKRACEECGSATCEAGSR